MNKLSQWFESTPATQIVAISFENIELYLFIVVTSLALVVCTIFLAALSGSWRQQNQAKGTPDPNTEAYLPIPRRLIGVPWQRPE